ncbi:Methionine ABC transporter ATP-binding protein [Cronobacter muytjensii 530]
MITLEGLSKTYAGEGRPALDDVSLAIPQGAVYGILGRSGAGKSTLLRCLNLLERPTAGRILMNGAEITRLDDRACASIASAPQWCFSTLTCCMRARWQTTWRCRWR